MFSKPRKAVVEQTKEVEKTYNDLKKGLDADLVLSAKHCSDTGY